MRLLHRQFASLPAQGLKARMSGVVPVNAQHHNQATKWWPETVKNRLFQLLSDLDDTTVSAWVAGIRNVNVSLFKGVCTAQQRGKIRTNIPDQFHHAKIS